MCEENLVAGIDVPWNGGCAGGYSSTRLISKTTGLSGSGQQRRQAPSFSSQGMLPPNLSAVTKGRME